MFARAAAKNESAKAGHSPSATAQRPKAANLAQNPLFSSAKNPRLPALAPRLPIQAKLKVGPVDDALEQEADRVADRVAHATEPAISAHAAPCHSGCQCAACQKARRAESVMQQEAPGSVGDVLRSSGNPLDGATKALLEPRFGFDFSQVRVHADSGAARSADEIGALAYTVGQRIVFGPGQYNPASSAGRRLLAHELAHVVQQNPAGSRFQTKNSQGGNQHPGPQYPASMHQAAAQTRSTATVLGQAAAGVIQRTPNPLDDKAKAIIAAAKDTSKPIDQRAIAAVTSIVATYYDPGKVDSVVWVESEPGLHTTSVGSGAGTKGKIEVGRYFIDNIDTFSRRVLQVGHELEHVQQYRDGKTGADKGPEREFLAFYWESTQPEKPGTGRLTPSTRIALIDGALGNYYCMPADVQQANATKKDELLRVRATEDQTVQTTYKKPHTDPPTTCKASH